MNKIFKVTLIILSIALLISMASCKKKQPSDKITDDKVPHSCTSICESCGKCTNAECTDSACSSKCNGNHIDLPEIDVDDLH